MKKLILPILSLLSLTFYSCSDDDAVVDGITLDRGSVTFTLDGASKNFTLLNSFTIDDTDTTVLLGFGDSEDEILSFGFTTPTSFPATPSGDNLGGGYIIGDDYYLASNSEIFQAGSVALTVTSYTNEVMTGTFSMTAILFAEDGSTADSVAITDGIFTNIPTSGS